MSEKTRYSEEELQEFKDIILKKLDKAKKDYDLLKNTITLEDGNDTQDTSPTFKVLEEGAAVLSKEEAGNWPSASRNLSSICRRLWCALKIRPMGFVGRPVS